MPRNTTDVSYDVYMFIFFKKLLNYFPKWLLPFYIPTSNIQMSASSPAFDGVTIFHFTHSDWCVVICLTTSMVILISMKDWKSITSALSAPTYTSIKLKKIDYGLLQCQG